MALATYDDADVTYDDPDRTYDGAVLVPAVISYGSTTARAKGRKTRTARRVLPVQAETDEDEELLIATLLADCDSH